ncbi:hypothetical protein [Bradyrhizobium sp. CCBAU 53421]|uniref:hypothetical protein n=1 Tax=Bradyrhizobium sp. CCBAU 53421 TaxID=1325120 RepID=UPI00188B6EBE|nr:hypothetical protein [Bradyrhizobium sp. CCBAU 53421]
MRAPVRRVLTGATFALIGFMAASIPAVADVSLHNVVLFTNRFAVDTGSSGGSP